MPSASLFRAASDTLARPDFHIHTAALNVSGETSDGLLRVSAVGSSTIQDLQGDTMTLSALQDMTKAPVGLLVFLNHMYNVPEDVAGHLYASPTIRVQSGIGDLLLDMALYTNKPRIAEVAKDIASGGRHGVSIGCMVTDAEWRTPDGELVDPDELDFWDIIEGKVCLHITGVDALEWSIVGIPANQRSWVQSGARGLLQRGLSTLAERDTKSGSDADGERARMARELKLLAPLVRAWWPNNFSSLVRESGVDETFASELLKLPSRKSGRSQITWTPTSDERGWQLVNGARGAKSTQTLTRADVERLIVTTSSQTTPLRLSIPADGVIVSKHTSATVDDETLDETSLDETLDAADIIDETKGVSGKTSWPLAARDRAWDSGAAEKRLHTYAGLSDDGSFDHAKYASVHFWYDSSKADDLTAYKLAFCDVIDGKVYAIPRGIMACTGAHGVDAADIPASDKDGIKKRISGYYARMREEFDDDTLVPSWEKEDGAMPDYAEFDASARYVKGMLVKADGSHDAYTGTHTHAHSAFKSQGGDDNHEHEHSHDGDSSHDHHSADEKALEPELVASLVASADASADECCHKGAACGADCTCGAECACKSASAAPVTESPMPSETASVEPVVVEPAPVIAPTVVMPAADVTDATASVTASAVVDTQRAALLKTYQDMLAPLGFVVRDASDVASGEATLAETSVTQKMSLDDDDAQELVTCISAADAAIDRAMALLDIPDADEQDDDDDAAEKSEKSVERLIVRTLGLGLALKAGKRHSAADMEQLQAIHDACMSLTDGAVCTKSATDDGAGESSSAETPTNANTGDAPSDAPTTVLVGVSALTEQLGALTKSLAGLGALSTLVDELETRSTSLDELLTRYTAQAQTYSDNVAKMREHVEKLSNMPLPRPTQTTRSVVPTTPARIDPMLARYEDFFSAPIPADAQRSAATSAATPPLARAERQALLSDALAQTCVVTRASDGVECREWPAGVGVGVRPALNNEQRARMSLSEWAAYDAGGAALVPTLGEALDVPA